MFALAVGRLVGIDEIERYLVEILFYISPGRALVPQFWSLPYEVFFYLLCPLILANRRAVHWTGAAAVVLTAITIGAKGITLNPYPSFFANFFGNELLLFAAGALTFYHADRVPRLSGRALAIAAALLFVAAWAFKWQVGASNFLSNVAIIAMAVLAIRNLPDRIAGYRPLNWGFFSYSIYIFHYALIEVARWCFIRFAGYSPAEIRSPFAWMLVVPLVLGACFLLYLVSERPANALVARLRRKGTTADTAPAGAGSQTGGGQ